MPAPVVHLGAVVTCMHAGAARPAAPSPRVLVNGQPVATMAALYLVTGCALANTATPPCVTAKWVTAATRVFVGGVPVVTQASRAICAPTGQPLLVNATQPRVLAT